VKYLGVERTCLVGGTSGGLDGINGLEEGLARGLASLGLLLPTLVPGAVGGDLQHVVTVETGDGDERNRLGVVADLLDEVGGLLDDFVVTVLGPFALVGAISIGTRRARIGERGTYGVHLVKGDNELPDTEGEREQSVLTSLAILGDTSLELTSTRRDDQDGAVSLGGTSDHVLDEVTVTRGIWDCVSEAAGRERLQSHEPMTVTSYLAVWNFQRAMSMVIPRSRSALSLSKTQAYLNEPLPSSLASFSNFSMVRASIPPHL
jgi:hypothetical protein